MAQSLGVSRVSLREALNTLQALGLLEIRQGNNTFVRPITTLSIYDPLVSFTKKSRENLLQVFEVRKYLEMGLAALAAQRATSQHLKRLESIVKAMEEDLKRNRLGAQSDFDFHTVLSEAAQNYAYSHVVKTIYDLLQEELRMAWGATFKKKDVRAELFQQHQEIYLAVKDGESSRAYEAAARHLTFVEEQWQKGL
jgi:GntR family transcriptional repressor for pyruvate dehydrogenase complex